jgi:sensor domain CHASE-containing protein/anti-sigma regulatory factor (Ser/Thr protein kinase)
MNIRPKVMAWVAGLFAALVAMQILIQEREIMPSFASLEQADARTSMTRVGYALERTLEGLESTASDWSDWGELFQFMQNRNPAFLATYTTPVAMAPLKVDMLLLVDREGTVVFSAARALGTDKPLSIDLAKVPALPQNFPWRRDLTTGRSMRGLVRTDQGVMMLAAAPILDGSGKGESLGLAILGRLLTPTQVQEIGTQAQATLTAQAPPDGTPAPDLIEAGDITQVFHAYEDIYGRPVMTLRVDVPRSLTIHAHAAVTYSLWYLVAASIVVLIFLIMLLNRLVLNPIARVTRHAVAVGAGGDLTARLDFAGDDEIGRLAREFDRMVERVAESRRQLVDQAFHAGYAELAKGIMHQLENAMALFGAHLSMLAGRLRGAPAADVAAAAGELTQDSLDAQRRADLTEFVQKGCEQIHSAVTQAQADVAVMERQASIVTSTLAEQRASAGNEHVLESVRLPELLAQTLDIVPEACRRRLVVETDDSWRGVGVVTVARTVLRLVLQNLIINAADAVHEAGLGQGAIRLTADIERGEGPPQLHIQCRDNGNGISPEHLKQVFEKGYSTKSRSTTNEGIGLHWCANAVHSLGGRIWAVSEGPGLGASLHVLFPIANIPATNITAANNAPSGHRPPHSKFSTPAAVTLIRS